MTTNTIESPTPADHDRPLRLVPTQVGATTPDYTQIPRLRGGDANTGRFYREVSAPLRLLLGDGHLPDVALVALAASAGPGGTQVLTGNRWMSEQLWCAVYAATGGIGRTELFRDRILSDRQRDAVVHVARERSPWVLAYFTYLFTDVDLAHIDGFKLTARARAAVSAELGERKVGTSTALVRDDGRGVVELRHPGRGFAGDPATTAVGARVHPEYGPASGSAIGDFLVETLGEDPQAWLRLAQLLSVSAPGETTTWATMAAAAVAADL